MAITGHRHETRVEYEVKHVSNIENRTLVRLLKHFLDNNIDMFINIIGRARR